MSPSASRSPSASPSPSTSPSPSSSPQPGKSCSAAYVQTNQWPGGFGVTVTVKNTGTVATAGWTVKWTYANGQTISSLWSGNLTQTGANVTVTNLSYNGALTPSATTTFGFNGVWTTANALPTNVTCTAS
uniref:cellulose binding domain-containing protein n=1 Tax=Allocatelliglobosispora scoriae TaxID=643052 RepID=UPI0035E405B9